MARSAPREGGRGCRNNTIIIISNIIVVAKALTLRCPWDVGRSLGRLQTTVGLGLAWGSLWEGGFEEGSCVAPPAPHPQHQNVGSGTGPSLQGPGRERPWHSCCRGSSLVFFSYSWPTGPVVVGVAGCGFSKLFGVGWVCLPTAPRHPPPRACPPSRSSLADEWWL